MGSRLLFSILAVCILAAAALLFFLEPARMWWVYVPLALALIALVFLLRSVVLPSTVAVRGVELISAQDLNNRLAPVGEHSADKIVKMFNAIIDKLREERLHNMEQDSFLSRLIEESPMGVMILNFDDKVSLVNNSMLRYLGMSREEEALGHAFGDLHSDMAAKMAEVPLGESVILRRGDVRRYRCYHLSFIQTGFRRRFYLLESLTEEVMKAEKEAYEKVIRIISHEVNNTMGGVKSVLGMLHDSSDDNDVREVIQSCDDRCAMMCSFISAYADVVRVPEPVLSKVNLAEALAAMLPFLRNMAGNDIEISASFDEKLTVDIDTTLIQQVVVNIVKNAVESIDGHGHIYISARRDGRNVRLEIANDGQPITDEVAQKLFSPFFTTKKEGRGLGLTLIGEILRRHNAAFSLTTPDALTRFRISFPAAGGR
ncbi:MAG: GHKL domain-containing protein [Muribaculaceae bacterium]|nr:GHKL domain-containing protein [Muribaculaceae bacterium]